MAVVFLVDDEHSFAVTGTSLSSLCTGHDAGHWPVVSRKYDFIAGVESGYSFVQLCGSFFNAHGVRQF
jgi:hypothetical protein